MAKRKLTRRQRERIGAIQERRREQAEERARKAVLNTGATRSSEGLVITRHGHNLVVQDQAGGLQHCLFRSNLGHPVCGDRVIWQPTALGEGVVTALLPRRTTLARPNISGRVKPLAANLSQLVILVAPTPRPSGYLIDQYLVTAENIGVGALLAINKCDLLSGDTETEFHRLFDCYRQTGYPVIQISARFDHGLDPLLRRLRGQTSILVGQSGVGKSSLVKALLPDIRIQTGQVSQASGQGRHTTSTTTLYRLPSGGQLIDSPGVRSFRLDRLDRQQLEKGFREFAPFLGNCRFNDCGHKQEPGCALIQAVANGSISERRMRHFLHMAAELSSDS